MDYNDELDELQDFLRSSRHRGDTFTRYGTEQRAGGHGGQHLHECPDTDGGNRCTECLLEILICEVFALRLDLASYHDRINFQEVLNERKTRLREEKEEELKRRREQ